MNKKQGEKTCQHDKNGRYVEVRKPGNLVKKPFREEAEMVGGQGRRGKLVQNFKPGKAFSET